MMDSFKKCDRCGSVWAYGSKFVYVELYGERYGVKCWQVCPNCAPELFWFMDHPEEQEEEE
jgi:ferredoxin